MTPNMAAIEEYRRKEEVYLQRLGELNALTAERDATRKDFDDLRKQRLDEFMAGFGVITSKLKEMYQVFLGCGVSVVFLLFCTVCEKCMIPSRCL